MRRNIFIPYLLKNNEFVNVPLLPVIFECFHLKEMGQKYSGVICTTYRIFEL